MSAGRSLVLLFAAAAAAVLLLGCTTPQERSGHSLRPFNSPASWENNPYYGVPIQN